MEGVKKYFVDSDVLIDYLRGQRWARDFLLKIRKKRTPIISVINVAEIYSGKEIKNPVKRKIIDQFLSEFEIVPLDENLAKYSGEIRLNYQLPFADAIVAATAIYTQSVLVTRNVKHFSKIKNLKIKKP